LALKKERLLSPKLLLHNTESYLKAEKLNCSFGKQLLERKFSQQASSPSLATLIQWPTATTVTPSQLPPAKAGWPRAE